MIKPLIIGISGGTGSGKSRFAKELIKRCVEKSYIYISQDSYYNDLSHISFEERCEINFDDPAAINFSELKNDLNSLIKYKEIKLPIYDYTTHTRKNKFEKIKPKNIIILEGIFSFHNSDIRYLIDVKIFVDTPADIRILRRAKRDINKRERTIESVFTQYLETVRPMHKKFVEPTKTYADIIVPNGGKNKQALDIINNKILPMIKKETNVNS